MLTSLEHAALCTIAIAATKTNHTGTFVTHDTLCCGRLQRHWAWYGHQCHLARHCSCLSHCSKTTEADTPADVFNAPSLYRATYTAEVTGLCMQAKRCKSLQNETKMRRATAGVAVSVLAVDVRTWDSTCSIASLVHASLPEPDGKLAAHVRARATTNVYTRPLADTTIDVYRRNERVAHHDVVIAFSFLALGVHVREHMQDRELGACRFAGPCRRAHKGAVAAAEQRAEHLHMRCALHCVTVMRHSFGELVQDVYKGAVATAEHPKPCRQHVSGPLPERAS